MEKEIWKDIKEFEEKYQISDKGNVKSLPRYKRKKEKILKPGLNNYGYFVVVLMKNKIRYDRIVHRLVAGHFISNPENKPQVNHKNGIKTDNKIKNLEWCTNSENKKHSAKNKLESWGERHYKHKLTKKDVKEIRGKYKKEGITQTELARQYPVNRQNISEIVNYKTWRHI